MSELPLFGQSYSSHSSHSLHSFLSSLVLSHSVALPAADPTRFSRALPCLLFFSPFSHSTLRCSLSAPSLPLFPLQLGHNLFGGLNNLAGQQRVKVAGLPTFAFLHSLQFLSSRGNSHFFACCKTYGRTLAEGLGLA